MLNPIKTIRTIARSLPAVIPHLIGRARWIVASKAEYKTYDYYLRELERMVTNVYNNDLGGDFIDILASLIYGQLEQAYNQAWTDDGNEDELPEYLAASFEAMYLAQYDFVDQYFKDIVDARIDQTPIGPLLSRATQWAGQWDTAYKEAQRLIAVDGGGNLIWVKGETEHGCNTCANLDGIVARASEWEALGVHPRGYPNSKLECEGGGPANNCDCTLEPTEQRRSAGAYGKIEESIL